MIRLNTASSNASRSRRRNQSSNGGGGSGGNRNSFNSQKSNEDNATHDDMYDDNATNNVPSSKVNRLFEELLGDNASAIGSVKGGGGGNGDESTAMSSVLGPILRANNNKGGGDNNNKDGSARKGGGVLNMNSNNSSMLNQLGTSRRKKQQQQQQQQLQQDEETDCDTFMTKPREIAFDQNDDDVSALFGGHGGTGGVESYMGTVANVRKNRQRGGGGGGGFLKGGAMESFGARGGGGRNGGGGRKNLREEDSRRTGATSTFQSMGVTTILEEIGMGSTAKKDKGSVDSGDDSGDKKGHGRWSNSRSNRNNNNNNGASKRGRHDRGGGKHHKTPQTFSPTNKWVAAFVTAMFVAIQFTTIQKRDKATLDHMNWRFQNHRFPDAGAANRQQQPQYARPPNAGGGVASEGTGNAGRRRGGYGDAEEGLGDVIRKTVPLLPQQNKQNGEWENEQMAMDDFLGGPGKQNLRGGGGGGGKRNDPKDDWEARKREDDRKIAALHQRKMAEEQRDRQKQEDEEQRRRIRDKQQQKEAHHQVGDTHPLLQPGDGLSMESSLEKLKSSGDSLSVIDPLPPQQRLSNDILPPRFHVFADLKTPYLVGRDTPFFWHIPRSGGVVVKTMLSHCLGQTLAAEVGELEGHDKDSEVKVISFSEHNYTNVNIATPEGISRALDLGLVPSHLSHTLVSAHVDLIPSLYNANDRARAFVMFRHPVDRAASMFYFLKDTGYPPMQNMTLDDYAKSPLIENNWLVRILSESMTGPIDMDNLEIAKEVLRRKFIVGLLDNKRGSFARFDHYFKWKESPKYEKEFGCRKQLMDEKYVSKHPIRKDTETWKLLHEQNRFDLHLYDFAKELFSQQSYIFGL